MLLFVHGARLGYFWIRGVLVARGSPSSAVTMDDRMDTKHGVHVFVLKNGNKEESASEARSTARVECGVSTYVSALYFACGKRTSS